jgi:molybdopterin-guanine dinucleotide biosynthesis protein A
MTICAVIVAGGRSSRMGREKALETVRGLRMIDRVIACLTPQVDRIAINANGDAARFADAGLEVFPDSATELRSPLAGLHAALGFASRHGFDAALTVPSDAPFLPADLVRRLVSADWPAAIAASAGQAHYLTGLWACSLLSELEASLANTARMQDWASRCQAAVVEWPTVPFDPFFNVNTLDELADAERLAAEFAL